MSSFGNFLFTLRTTESFFNHISIPSVSPLFNTENSDLKDRRDGINSPIITNLLYLTIYTHLRITKLNMTSPNGITEKS